jgi:hypothetical protein
MLNVEYASDAFIDMKSRLGDDMTAAYVQPMTPAASK